MLNGDSGDGKVKTLTLILTEDCGVGKGFES